MKKYDKINLNNFIDGVNKSLQTREPDRWVLACTDDIWHTYGNVIHMKMLDRKTNTQASREFKWKVYRCFVDHENGEKDYKVEPDIWDWVVWFVAKCEGYKVYQEYSEPMRNRYYQKVKGEYVD